MQKVWWSLWSIATLLIGSLFSYILLASDDKSPLLIGEASHGHHQIEMACGTCHTGPFSGREGLQEACLSCHAEELHAADDSHPVKKFTDPRNADRLAVVDARQCVACHKEHQLEQTRTMGVTLPEDFCLHCHEDVAEERPSHQGMAFDTCASAGCHNYHDNRALYEDFLLKHAGDPDMIEPALRKVLQTGLAEREDMTVIPRPDAPNETLSDAIVSEWQMDIHAGKGVNCSGCHLPDGSVTWQESPDITACKTCHDDQAGTFIQGKHGMRLNSALLAQQAPFPKPVTLPAMTPASGRLPFKTAAFDQPLGCNSCHQAHEFNQSFAATEACLGCHNDEHSLAFEQSSHAQVADMSCATCHMPATEQLVDGDKRLITQHNQNHNLRPNEKMIRGVCQNCHGLSFSLDALADQDLINNNFEGQPVHHIESVPMVLKAHEQHNAPTEE
ncbi:MAG: cytochrome c3 family protein [Hahellaceae bacterium]|nr:cytochrome c3 family protein [Hahellaceae bacterium]